MSEELLRISDEDDPKYGVCIKCGKELYRDEYSSNPYAWYCGIYYSWQITAMDFCATIPARLDK